MSVAALKTFGTYKNRLDPRLIESDPIFHTVAKALVANTCVSLKVLLRLRHIKPASVSVMQPLREIPMIQSCPRCDTARQKTINKSVVERDSGLVQGIAATTFRDDARP